MTTNRRKFCHRNHVCGFKFHQLPCCISSLEPIKKKNNWRNQLLGSSSYCRFIWHLQQMTKTQHTNLNKSNNIQSVIKMNMHETKTEKTGCSIVKHFSRRNVCVKLILNILDFSAESKFSMSVREEKRRIFSRYWMYNLSIMESNKAVSVMNPLLNKLSENVFSHFIQGIHQKYRIVIHGCYYHLKKISYQQCNKHPKKVPIFLLYWMFVSSNPCARFNS